MNVQEIGCKGVECIQLSHDKEKRPALLKTVINLWVIKDSASWSQFVKIFLFMSPLPKQKMKRNL